MKSKTPQKGTRQQEKKKYSDAFCGGIPRSGRSCGERELSLLPKTFCFVGVQVGFTLGEDLLLHIPKQAISIS